MKRPLTIDLATGMVAPASVNGHPLTLPAGARLTDFNSLGDARWVRLANLNSLGDARWVQLANLNSLGDARWSPLGHTHTFESLTSKPTTIAGYGITDLNSLGDARWALDSAAVHKTGDETLAGIKTFSSAPVVPAASFAQVAVINLVSDLAAKVPVTRTVNGQALSGNVLLSTADVNDSTDRRYVTDAQRTVIQNTSGANTGDQDLSTYAHLASPAFTGTPTAPTAVNATSTTQLATTAFVHAVVTDLINAAPGTLDTLKELADAIGDDPNFATTIATSIATKLAKASNLSDLTDPAVARTNLGGTTVGKALFTLANPGAVSFLQVNLDNSVTAQSASAQKSALGMGSVENTALSTWAGSAALVTLGTVSTGTWTGTKISEIYGGTNQATYTLGDLLYASAANTLSKLAGNTTSTKKFLTQTGTGTVAAAPAWGTLVAGDIPDLSATYQPLAAGLSSWGGVTRATGFDTFTATPTLANLKALVTDETAVGWNLLTLTSPSAVTFLKIAADNSVTAESASAHRTSLSLVPGTDIVAFNGAGGTPTSLVLTNATGSPTGISLTKAQLNTIVSDDDPAYLGTAQTFTAAQTNSTAGAASAPALKLSGTPFAGTGTTSFPLVYLNDSAATASTTLATSGTYLGVNGHGSADLINLLLDGTSKFKVGSTGATTIGGDVTAGVLTGNAIVSTSSLKAATASAIYWDASTTMTAPADGLLLLQNFANTGFTGVKLGGATSSFPYIKRNATAINFRLADDSADAPITASNGTFSGTLAVTGHATLEGVTSTGATGTGKHVYDTSPTLVTPALGAATATTINGAALDNSAWTTYTPTITSGGGTITTVGAVSGRYKQIGKTVFLELNIVITTAGTAVGDLLATLPVTAVSGVRFVMSGREDNVTGKMLQGYYSDTTHIGIRDYSNTHVFANGATVYMSGVYEAN